MLIALGCLFLLLSGCSKGDDVLRLEEKGYVAIDAVIFQSLTGRYETPQCSGKTPTTIEYIFIDVSTGLVWNRQSPIALVGNDIAVQDVITLPVGNYNVIDIAIISADATVTHRVPSDETSGFNFTGFTDISTPFAMTILPEQTTNVDVDVFCYTSELLDLNGNVGGSTKILDLQTLYYQLPDGGCMDRVTIDTDGRRIIDEPVTYGPGTTIKSTPILKDFTLMTVTAWDGTTELDSVDYTVYNTDGVVTYTDVVQFNNANCN